jgi:hypothetical protein
MIIRSAVLVLVSFLTFGCTTTEAEKDAHFSTPRIPLSDGTVFTQRATPASTCRQKWVEIKRVGKITKQENFLKRGKGEILVFTYQAKLLTDFMQNCREFIFKGGR